MLCRFTESLFILIEVLWTDLFAMNKLSRLTRGAMIDTARSIRSEIVVFTGNEQSKAPGHSVGPPRAILNFVVPS